MKQEHAWLVIQHVTIEWDKAARGASGVVRRKAIAHQHHLLRPTYLQRTHNVLIHTIGVTDYQQQLVQTERLHTESYTGTTFGYKSIEVTFGAPLKELQYQYQYAHTGVPRRDATPKTVGTLGEGQWACIEYNGRIPYETTWAYRYHIINVGVFPDLLPNIFTTHSATLRHKDLAKLW
jgi:hypothetical protein